MALRTSSAIVTISLLLSLALLFLSVHVYQRSSTNSNISSRRLLVSTTNMMPSKNHHHHHHHHHHQHHDHHHHQDNHHQLVNAAVLPGYKPKPSPDPGGEIDPRYGVQKRLVPNGPNPLHH